LCATQVGKKGRSFTKVIKAGTRLALATIICLALVSFTPVSVQAQEPIDLVLGGEEATSWNICDTKPGDSGIKIVELHNAGSKSGSLTIWISDIVNSEGNNPESETDDTTEPGELADHLAFALSCNRLSGEVPRSIEMEVCEESLSTPSGIEVVGPAFELTGYTKYSVPCSVIFDQPAKLTLSYDSIWLPEDTSRVFLASYDVGQTWKELAQAPDSAAELGEITALVTHLSTLAVLAELAPSSPPPSLLPAHFVATDLNIVPSQEKLWEPVTFMTMTGRNAVITADIANDGGQEGTYIVKLKIDGKTVDGEQVTVEAGQSQQVSFTLYGMDYGQHKVELAGLSCEFTVSRRISWSLIIGVIVAIALIAWGVAWARRKGAA